MPRDSFQTLLHIYTKPLGNFAPNENYYPVIFDKNEGRKRYTRDKTDIERRRHDDDDYDEEEKEKEDEEEDDDDDDTKTQF